MIYACTKYNIAVVVFPYLSGFQNDFRTIPGTIPKRYLFVIFLAVERRLGLMHGSQGFGEKQAAHASF